MKKSIEFFYREVKDHVLEPLEVGEKLQAFYLREPGRVRCMSCLILFTPEGIVIQGDYTPERNGSVSVLGYGLKWFGSELSPRYLAQKFLQKKWTAENAEADLEELIEDFEQNAAEYENAAEIIKALKELDPDDDGGPWAIWENWPYEFIEYPEDGVGWDYIDTEIGILAAIQRRFSEEARRLGLVSSSTD